MTDELPENSEVEMERAQVALRVGLDRARHLVREARLEIGGRAARQAEPQDCADM